MGAEEEGGQPAAPATVAGFALRFPRILRLRTDKTPADINTLEDVRRLYRLYRAVYEREGTAAEESAADAEAAPEL